ncbi:LOB DOMAIN-CONTAINING PROTEIN 38 [Salix purpurea]|uniref:LOB DOMAIN-CONTAINING PROTEIN 38 n=1 Tax=Salix purpurea TaxID=77065 RepID=A0A9Q0VI45_SALPP|nr:LOB DOMAIN-CONTAINING PROTEIN 38 [Salix purpurea]
MRASCNGCRVLRKGCGDDCSIKPCLQWIKNPDSQANATLFLAKFYGRAGLMNLINDGPQHLRPAIFKSLLYEACGRIVNPVYGSVGLLWTGSWQQCQAAVEAVLKGEPITEIESTDQLALDASDIRHVSKEGDWSASHHLRKVKPKSLFKRSASKPKSSRGEAEHTAFELMVGCDGLRSVSPDSVLSWRPSSGSDSGETDSLSVETVEACKPDEPAERSDLGLDLTLGNY